MTRRVIRAIVVRMDTFEIKWYRNDESFGVDGGTWTGALCIGHAMRGGGYEINWVTTKTGVYRLHVESIEAVERVLARGRLEVEAAIEANLNRLAEQLGVDGVGTASGFGVDPDR